MGRRWQIGDWVFSPEGKGQIAQVFEDHTGKQLECRVHLDGFVGQYAVASVQLGTPVEDLPPADYEVLLLVGYTALVTALVFNSDELPPGDQSMLAARRLKKRFWIHKAYRDPLGRIVCEGQHDQSEVQLCVYWFTELTLDIMIPA